jgi:hypothetical protein
VGKHLSAEERLLADCAQQGFDRITVPGTRTMLWQFECSKCHTVEKKGWRPAMQPEQIAAKLRQTGWLTRPLVCIECQRKEKPMSNVTNIGPDPKIARKIYAMLDDHFNETKRVYNTGWDDAKVAKELDLSVTIVERIRREAYGELAENPEITVLKDDVAFLRLEVQEAVTKITKATAATINEFNAKLVELENRLARLHIRKAG